MRADPMAHPRPPHSYSQCPLKKRPVHFYDPEESKDDIHENDILEPENLSTKPEDLRLCDRTKTRPNVVSALSFERHPGEIRTSPATLPRNLPHNAYQPLRYPSHHDEIISSICKERSSETPTSKQTSDPYRTAFQSWHHIAPHCLPYLYPYPCPEEVYNQYYTTAFPLQQPHTYSSRDSNPTHDVYSNATSLYNKHEPHHSAETDWLSPSSSAASPHYQFLGNPTPPRTPEELLSPRSVSSSEGSSAGSTGYGQRVVEINSSHRYKCSFCSKSYSTYSGLSKHQQFHCTVNDDSSSSKKKFSCKSCDKVYVTLGALKMHIRTHTLPCKCVICGKAFSRPWLLQGHIRTHTGEKPFSCPLCERAFADRSNLRAHLQTHSEVKKYSCASCGKTFSRMSLLTKHVGGGCSEPGHSSEDVSS